MNINDAQMVVKFVKQMYHSGHFDEQDLTSWESRTAANKTYANAKTYFQAKYREKMMFRKATARNMGYANKASQVNTELRDTLLQFVKATQADHQSANAVV